MRYVYIALGVLGLAVVGACKAVSQSDLDGPGVTPGVVVTADAGDSGASTAASPGICKRDAGTPATLPEYNLVQGQPCVHNRQCVSGTYCDVAATVCSEGSRGAGRTGVAPCTDGNMCTSGLCAQDAVGGFTCSDACDCDQDCGGKLPKCVHYAPFGIGVCNKS